ncbi:cytochrome oxidase putative small subunit CydP [Teredinibacter sp. KSP-S5-2]|uniref:cytochrome oxidase putative small subunit CydP n=1 Tax=Teredinibacter sp. KSP-S5-2 TaxID=3034506 RepID=UPI00293494EF|nr:cytochrome oxidase putative small subunit CydP [Teredinibacter sp. KSP-S5-2]WNO10770.1 hypothetical protein P5V12_06230 [Teredinibacter sp. KSP-S5-2]
MNAKPGAQSSIFAIPLVREISLVLIVKLIAIVVIRWLFFSQPVDLGNSEQGIDQHFGLGEQSPVSASQATHGESL